MYLLEISLLLFFSLSVHTRNTQIPKVWQRNTSRVNEQNDDHRNCFCYPEGPLPTTQNLLDSQNNGLERLVIYLYKNIGTNEIKMYTPSIEKQVLIPDIPYELGDGLITVINENIATLFYDNPNKVKVFNNRFETVKPSEIDSWPIGLNLGQVEIIYPNEVDEGNYYNPSNDHKVKDYIMDIPSNEQAVPKAESFKLQGIATPHKQPSPGEYDRENYESIEDFWWSDKIKDPQTHSGIINSYDGGYNNNVFAFNTNGGAIALPSGSTRDLNVPISDKNVTFTIWFNQQMKRFQKIQLPNDIKGLEQITLRILVEQTLAENNIHVNADGVMVDSNGVVIDAANLELRPLLLGEKIKQNIFQSPFTQLTLPKNLPYLEAILVTLVNPPQVLGIIPLGKTYLAQYSFLSSLVNTSTIYPNDNENGNSPAYPAVTKGPLTKTVKEANEGLYGVPVDTESTQNTAEEIISSEANIYPNVYTKPMSPSNSYLSTKNVPYRKMYIPYSGFSKLSYWSSEPYSTVSKEPINGTPLLNAQLLGKRRKLSDAKIEHHYEPLKSRRNNKKGKGRLYGKSQKHTDTKLHESKENTKPEPLTNVNNSESGRRFQAPSLKTIMKTLLYLLDDAPSRTVSGNDENSTDTDDIVNGSEIGNGGDQPDFRIIGGNAATGSGTPLSNKGRSGYEEYI